MPKLKINSMPQRKKIVPLVLAIANLIIKELQFVEIINDAVEWDRSHWNISPGSLLKTLVLCTFMDIRIPLTHLEERLEGIDIDYFLEPDDKSTFVNASNVGEAMDRLGRIDYDRLYESLALTAVHRYDMPVTRLHGDTTSISFYGEYDTDTLRLTEEEQAELLQIERGYNKDGRPEEKQVVVGQIVNEYGIPLVSQTMDGATSDVEWNREAIKYAGQIWAAGFEKGIFVADCKLITEEHVRSMNRPESRICFVSRCPANFCEKLEHRMIEKAYKQGQWIEIGAVRAGKDATCYKSISFIEELYGTPMRLLVLESNTLQSKAEQAIKKKEADVSPLLKQVKKRTWLCRADAEKEREQFLKRKELGLFDCEIEIEQSVEEKWPRGRRGAETKPVIKESYRLKVVSITRREEACQEYLQRESCFVIISNETSQLRDEELFRIYKGQQVVENSFRELKSPQLASVIYLKNPKRVQVLGMLLTFSLLLRALIQYRLRRGLEQYNREHPGETIPAGWGGRPLTAPTYKLLYEHSINCSYECEGAGEYSYAWPSVETKNRVAPLLMLMGITLEEILS